MAENSTSSATEQSGGAVDTKKRQDQGLIDADLLAELTLSEDVVKAAKVAERVGQIPAVASSVETQDNCRDFLQLFRLRGL